MPAPTKASVQPFRQAADLGGGFRDEGVKKGRFPDPRLAGEGRSPTLEGRMQSLDTLPSLGA